MSKKISFIGLGNMGGPMAANLVKAGYSVTAFDLMDSHREQAAKDGCQLADSAAASVEGADFVVTMLPNGKIVESVLIDKDRLLEVAPKTALFIDCSTVAPANSQRVSEAAKAHAVAMIDAPVSGGTAAAAAGTLAFMCGGAAEEVARAEEVLLGMGKAVFHAGDHGAGSVAKICNNMLLAIHMAGTAEALQMGVNNGLDPKVLSEIMQASSGNNWSLEKYNPYPGVLPNVPASNDYQGGFLTDLMLKDLHLADELASSSRSLTPMGKRATELYEQHRSSDSVGHSDFSSIQQLFKVSN